ncbi:hypothetical protein K0U83_00160, partial [bacterium]|nr:hypothetical protein [bacterium]
MNQRNSQYPGPVAQPLGQANVYTRELLLQSDPSSIARIEAYARSMNLELNWNLPLKAMIITATQEQIDRTGNTDPGRHFSMDFYFPFATWITSVTCNVRSMVFDNFGNTVTLPDPTYFAEQGVGPLGYIDFKWRRTNSEMITTGDDDGFTPAASFMGTGSQPYEFSLLQFITREERVTLEGRLAPQVGIVEQIKVSFNYLILPVG